MDRRMPYDPERKGGTHPASLRAAGASESIRHAPHHWQPAHGMDLEKLYRLTGFVMDAFHPVWYEAREETDGGAKTVWFQGFEAMIDGEKWNFDLWFFDRESIEKAETLCDDIAARATPAQRESITEMKRGLLARGLYSFEKFRSMDVYRAVLEENIQTIEGFLERYAPGKGTI